MKFRLSVQTKAGKGERRFISPALLSDPAFSADPHANPYFQPAWAFSPPAGHPTLKHNSHRQHLSIVTDLTPAPPPNSPAPPSAGPGPQHFLPRSKASPAAAPLSLSPSDSPFEESPVVTKPARPLSPPLPPPVKKLRMHFLSRRKSSTKLAVPEPKPKRDKHTSLPAFNDVTQRPDARPVPGSRFVSEPVKNVDSRPNVRRAATTGANTPRSTITAASAPSVAVSSSRAQDLDRIDELDESNPLGVALHHGGPYEIAVQALRRNAGNGLPLGLGSNFGDYPRQAMHAHGNVVSFSFSAVLDLG